MGNNTPVCIDDEISEFDLPEGWEFAKISTLLNIQTGASFKKESATTNQKLVRVLRGGNILNGSYHFFDNDIFLDNNLVPDSILLWRNDLITPAVTSIENIGKIARVEQTYNNVTAGGFVFILRPYCQIDELSKYLLYALQSSYFNKQLKAITKKSGQAFYNLGKERLLQLILPIPPLAEQVRIVAEIEKFEPLIAEYDKLEQQATKLDDEIYGKLKKSILQYAIQGKLVPQDPNDEPASVLLERIRAEKKAKLGKKYVDSYIYKGDDNCYYEKVGETVTNISDEMPFDLPENWAWCRLKTICSYIHRGKSPTYGTEKILPIIAQKCNQWSGIQTQKCLFADRATIKKYTEEQYLCVGDIIINSTGTGTVGRTGYVDDTLFKEYPKFVADSHVTVVRPSEYIDSKYIYLFLKSPVIQTDIEAKCSGSTNQIELATKTIQSYLIPLPPATEQYRITFSFFALEAKLKDED